MSVYCHLCLAVKQFKTKILYQVVSFVHFKALYNLSLKALLNCVYKIKETNL